MMLIINLILSALAIGIAAYIVPGVSIAGPVSAIVVAVVLGLINLFIKPILLFLTLPINILTLGLFSFVISAFLVMLAGVIVPGFTVAGFWPALIFALVLALITIMFGNFSKQA